VKKQRNELDKILSIYSERVINNDYTVRFKNNYYQLKEYRIQRCIKEIGLLWKSILKWERLKYQYEINILDYFLLPEKPKKEIEVKLIALTNRKQSNLDSTN